MWAGRLGAEIVTGEAKSDPASVAHRAVARAVESGADVCIVDTAGRLQTQQNLMKELTKIHTVIGKKAPGAPHEVLLVLDATTGQNGISQAKSFSEAVQCTGIVLAKIDGTAKGGVIVAIRQQVGLPVKYLGVGEKAEDMTLFNPDQFVEAMFEDLLPRRRAVASQHCRNLAAARYELVQQLTCPGQKARHAIRSFTGRRSKLAQREKLASGQYSSFRTAVWSKRLSR